MTVAEIGAAGHGALGQGSAHAAGGKSHMLNQRLNVLLHEMTLPVNVTVNCWPATSAPIVLRETLVAVQLVLVRLDTP